MVKRRCRQERLQTLQEASIELNSGSPGIVVGNGVCPNTRQTAHTNKKQNCAHLIACAGNVQNPSSYPFDQVMPILSVAILKCK